MSDKHLRHPLKNFFVKKSIQMKIIWQIIITVIIAASSTTGLLMFFYNLRSKEGTFYYMSNDVMKDLELKNIISIILPSIIVVEVIAIFIAFGIGLVSSRKIAVPIYKIEKWASDLKTGKLNTTLVFREEDNLNELTTQCNSVTDFYKTVFNDIRQHTQNIVNNSNDSATINKEIKALKQILDNIES